MKANELNRLVTFYCPCCKEQGQQQPKQKLVYGDEVCSECYSLMYDNGNSNNWQSDC